MGAVCGEWSVEVPAARKECLAPTLSEGLKIVEKNALATDEQKSETVHLFSRNSQKFRSLEFSAKRHEMSSQRLTLR
jgi:hypothetical protein